MIKNSCQFQNKHNIFHNILNIFGITNMASCKSTRLPQIALPKRGKQYSPSKNVIYSPLAVQQDQKQIILIKLKQEIKLLQNNKHQLDALKGHYKKLQNEYNRLVTEKKTNDNSFAKHHESALKEICLIKNEIDSIKITVRQNKLQIEDLSADENTLRNELDQKQIEIQKIKNDLRSSIADNQQLGVEREKLSEIHRNVAQERQKRADECQKLKSEIDKVQKKIQQMNRYQVGLQKQESALTEQIIKFQQLNNQADIDIATTCQDISNLDEKIQQSQNQTTDLQRKIAETGAFSQKFKTNSLFAKKSTQLEVMKNNDVVKNIHQAQSLLNVRINQVKEGHRQLDMLNEENISLQKINCQLEDDLEACKRHLENLALLNGQLVKQMQAISQEDEQVHDLVDKKARVERAREKVREAEQSRKDLKLAHEPTVSSSRYNSKKRFY